MGKADTIKNWEFSDTTTQFYFNFSWMKLSYGLEMGMAIHKFTRNTTRRYECKCKEIRDVMNALANDLIVIIVVVIPCEMNKIAWKINAQQWFTFNKILKFTFINCWNILNYSSHNFFSHSYLIKNRFVTLKLLFIHNSIKLQAASLII